MSDLDAGDRRLEPDVLLPFFGLWHNLGPMASWGRTSSAFMSPPVRPACSPLATYPGKLKLILSGFAETAAARAIFPVVHRAKPCTLEHSTTKGIPAAS